MGSFTKFDGATVQQWNGFVYDITWYIGIAARTLKKETLYQL